MKETCITGENEKLGLVITHLKNHIKYASFLICLIEQVFKQNKLVI